MWCVYTHTPTHKWNYSGIKRMKFGGISLAVQWLRLHASNAGGTGLLPGQETKIPHAI